jgi:hypothetical protein
VTRQALIKKCYVHTSDIRGAGRGLFVDQPVLPGDVLDESPVLLAGPGCNVPAEWTEHIYSLPDGRRALVLGDGVFANHSEDPTAEPRFDLRRKVVKLIALCEMDEGCEVTFDYGADW